MNASILVCTDGSPYANVACDYAFRLASAFNAKLTGLHVLDIRMIEGPLLADISGAIGAAGYFAAYAPFRDFINDKADSIGRAFMDNAKAAGIEPDFIQETGHPVHAILNHTANHSLVVLGRRGENESHGGELIGSVTDRIIRKANLPCLVTPSKASPIRRILAACDNSPIAAKVARTADEYAKRLSVPLVLMTAAEGPDREQARQALAAAAAITTGHGLAPAKTVLAEGQAADAILATATDEKCDLIIMGAHGHTRIREWFVGCTTLRVLADSALPALLVR